MNARVTALVPAYKAAGFIRKTLDSLSAQTYAQFDVIVSVDACDDDTFAICAAYALRDPRFKVLRQDRRLGYVGNCNFLLRQADADRVCFAFHDDILLPTYVEKLCAALDACPGAILAFSDMLVTDEVDGTEVAKAYFPLKEPSDPVERGVDFLNRKSYWSTPNRGIFRLARARRIRGLRRHGAGGYAPDLPWLFHMILLGEFVRVPETLCLKYYKAGSLSKTWEGTDVQMHAAVAACFREAWRSSLTIGQKARLATALKWSVLARLRDIATFRYLTTLGSPTRGNLVAKLFRR